MPHRVRDTLFTFQRNTSMSNTEIEIVVEDPTAPEPDSPPVAGTRTVDVIVSLLLLALAVTLGTTTGAPGSPGIPPARRPAIFRFTSR